MLAFVFGLLRALIQNVLSFVWTARMARTVRLAMLGALVPQYLQ